MKKLKAVLAAVCVLCIIVIVYAAVFQKRDTKADITEYVQVNQEALEQFTTILMAAPPKYATYNGWHVYYYPAAGMVEFITKRTGVGPATAYEGFYYSKDDRPIGFQGTEQDFVRDDTGWSWEEADGDNRERTEKITARWYWFQMNF